MDDRRESPQKPVASLSSELKSTRMQPTREDAIGNDFRDADVRIIEGYQCRLRNGGRFGKLVWSEVDHEFR